MSDDALRDLLDVPSDSSNLTEPVAVDMTSLDGTNDPLNYKAKDKAVDTLGLADQFLPGDGSGK